MSDQTAWDAACAAATAKHATWCPCGGYLPSDFEESGDSQ